MGIVIYTEDGDLTVSVEDILEWRDRALTLSALQAAGVDNWDGYDYAMELLRDWKDEG